MGRFKNRFGASVWIDVLLFEHVFLFLLLSIPETTTSTFLFLLHSPHVFSAVLGFGVLRYPGNGTTLRPLMCFLCINTILDLVAVVGHVYVAAHVTGRPLFNEIVYTTTSFAFVVNNCMLAVRAPAYDDSARPVQPGFTADVASAVMGQDADKRN